MGELKISNLVSKGEIEKLQALDEKLASLKETYEVVAKELVKGIKMEINTPKDLDKLYELYNAQAKIASKTTIEMNSTLEQQKKVLQDVADGLQKQASAQNLSSKEMKNISDAAKKNAEALEKVAKAEAAATKAQNAGNSSRKNVVRTEEDRLRVIKEAIALTNKEVHSIQEANEANTKMRQAVRLLKDTDEGYAVTLARMNSTIGINTDYVKRNSDRYTKQKMTIGAYREEIKAAIIDLGSANNSMKNLGIIANRCGGIIKTKFVGGLNDVGISVGKMVKGFVGAQVAIAGASKLFQLLKEGVNTAIDFEAANSKLAAILGTTADKTKKLQMTARELGATTKYTADEATNLQIELAKLGFTAEEIQQSTKYILQFAQATGSELPEAAALAGASLRMFNADTTETEKYVSAMAIATVKSALSFSYLQTALPIAGSVAKTFGFEIEDVLALLGKLADSGVDASSAATATRNILLNLANGSGKLSKALGGNIKTLDDFVKGLKHVKDGGMELAEMLDITDKRSVNAFANFVNGSDEIANLRKEITGCTKEFGDMASEMSNNTEGAIKGLSSAWDELMITIYGNTGAIRSIVETVTEAIRDLALAFDSAETSAEKLINKASTSTAGESDYQRDIDAIERKKKAKIAAGKEENEAQKEALEEQELLLKESLKKEVELKNEAQSAYDSMLKNANDENYRFQDKAKEWLKDDANKLATYIQSSNVLEARLKKVQNLLRENKSTNNGTDALTDEQKKELEKQAKERQRILETMQQSDLDLMDEGLQKELAKIALSYNKKIAAVRGNSEEEQKTRENLAKKMQQDLGDYEVDFYLKKEQERIENKLAVVKKGSDEEYKLQLSLLNIQEEAEKESAIRKNEDILAIEEKYTKKRQEILEEQSGARIKAISENAAAEQVALNQQYQKNMLDLKKQFSQKGNNVTDKDKEDYEENKYQITKEYALKSAEAAIDALEMELAASTEGSDERSRIAEELQNKKAELANKAAELEIKAIDLVNKKDEEAKQKRMDNLKQWLQSASDAVGSIGDLIGTLYDGKIAKIEDEQEANDKVYDRDIEHIENLAETGAISEEEAEARKRAAEDKTAAKNAELEKKKQAMAKKQATWDKATSIAQAGIATALAITKALPNFIFAAIVGAMGAIQVATIAATPIPSYAEGTKDGYHPGGKALIGDAGKHEVVMYNGLAWITPDTPMMVDLPRGAKVFPDVDEMETLDWNSMDSEISFANHKFMGSKQDIERTTVINDFSRLERKMDENNKLLAQRIKQQRKYDVDRDFELYKLKKL